MANAFYAKCKEKMLTASINFASDTIKAAAVKNSYSADLTGDEFFSSISAHVVGTPQALDNKDIAGGVFDADDVTFAALTAGNTLKGVVLYKDSGVAGTSSLIAYIDAIAGFPIATNGGDISVRWDNGANRIFSL